jgi:hypothetical protein
MGLAPSRNGENAGKSAVAKVPVPILSQPRLVPFRVAADGEVAFVFLNGAHFHHFHAGGAGLYSLP